MTGAMERTVSEAVSRGDAQALVDLLVSHPADEVIGILGRSLQAMSFGHVALLASRFEAVELQVGHRVRIGLKLGLLGEREEVLRRTEARAAEARLRVHRELGALYRSLPDDPGGRVAPGEPVPIRRKVRDDLGLSRNEAAQLAKLGSVDDAAFEVYVGKVRDGARPPASVAAVVRDLERTTWGSDECYTPAEWLVAGRRALGVERFSADLMSCLAAQLLVRAEVWHSLDSERPEPGEREVALRVPFGLGDDLAWHEAVEDARARWGGRDGLDPAHLDLVRSGWWWNPGYAADVASKAHEGIRRLRDRGRAGVVLVNADASKADQRDLLASCLHAWPKGRIAFYTPNGERQKGNAYAQVLFGVHVDAAAWGAALADLAECTRPLTSVS